MTFQIQRYIQPVFFNWLAALTSARHEDIRVFNDALACGYVAIDALSSWKQDQFYVVPDVPGVVTELIYFMSSAGKRIFCAAVYGDSPRAVLFEVTMLQLLVTAKGIRTVGGKVYNPRISQVIAAPDDRKFIESTWLGKQSGQYLGLIETVPVSGPETGKPGSANGQPRDLIIDVGSPQLAACRFNLSESLNYMT